MKLGEEYSPGSQGILLLCLQFYIHRITELGRLEGTFGGLQYNLVLKADPIRAGD